MLCRYTFSISSALRLEQDLCFRSGNTSFVFKSVGSRFDALIVEVSGVSLPHAPRFRTGDSESIPTFSIPSDPAFAFLQHELQSIKGALHVWGVDDIDTRRPKFDWIPETEEEKATTQITSFSSELTLSSEPEKQEPALDLLIRTILSRRSFLDFELPLEFFRRASLDSENERFIEAIYGFYFVLEFLFGNGKYRKKELMKQFGDEPRLLTAIDDARTHPHPEVMRNPRVRARYKEIYLGKSNPEVISHIVDLRGYLHHQSLSRPRTWNPHHSEEFMADSFFLMMVVRKIVVDFCVDKLFDEKEVELFTKVEVTTNDGRKVSWTPRPD